MSNFDKTPRWSTDFEGIKLRVIGLTYDVSFTAQYEWTLDGDGPYWECIQIDGLVVRCHNGEDVYDGFEHVVQCDIDDMCIAWAMEHQPSNRPSLYD